MERLLIMYDSPRNSLSILHLKSKNDSAGPITLPFILIVPSEPERKSPKSQTLLPESGITEDFAKLKIGGYSIRNFKFLKSLSDTLRYEITSSSSSLLKTFAGAVKSRTIPDPRTPTSTASLFSNLDAKANGK